MAEGGEADDDEGNEDEGDEKGSSESSPFGRWWEQYAVRYFVGTVLGALILGVLVIAWSRGKGNDWLPIAADSIKKLDPKAFTALGAIGLAYCYVASAPILTFHAVRGAFALDEIDGAIILLCSLALTFALYLVVKMTPGATASWIALLIIFGLQLVVISIANKKSFAETKQFYDELIEARLDAKKRKTDYIDSYRHLREHGNAFAIVFCELALGFILLSIKGREEIGLAIGIWVLPGAWSWVIGNVMEKHFVSKRRRTV